MALQSPTAEQQQIAEHVGDARVRAYAGTGKTSTLVHYASLRKDQRILYLAYNKSVKQEAIRKFFDAKCTQVTVETAHSLAFRGMDVRRRFQLLESGNLRINDVVDLCSLSPSLSNPSWHLVTARHIIGCLNHFCNSAASSFADIDYPATISDNAARKFAEGNRDFIYGHARALLARMYRGEIPLSHDCYLKFYQLQAPSLDYDTILFDEAQDASPVQLDLVLRQQWATKIFVGDQHQQIYGFRGALNSLEQVDFPDFALTQSFRFGQEIADIAVRTLRLKKLLGRYPREVDIRGIGGKENAPGHAVLARTNITLLSEAIDAMLDGARKLHFEGDLASYTYMSEGASLFDVLYLRLAQPGKVRSRFIRSFSSYDALEEYAREAGDRELGLVIGIVNKFGPSLFDYIRRLKTLQVPKEAAEIVFATGHKAKGQEYGKVVIADDFLHGEKLRAILATAEKKHQAGQKVSLDKDSLAEEINLLYVALTRAQNEITIPFDVERGAMPEKKDDEEEDEQEAGAA